MSKSGGWAGDTRTGAPSRQQIQKVRDLLQLWVMEQNDDHDNNERETGLLPKLYITNPCKKKQLV